MRVNDQFEVLIEGMDKDGKGFCHIDKTIVFIEGALTNEKCTIEITNVISNCAFAKVINYIDYSKSRIVPDCPYYNLCGGCDMQHMTYDLEKEIKENKVKNALKFIAKESNPKVKPIIFADEIWHYRNKAIIPFGVKNGKIVCGMYQKKSHEIIDFTSCLIEPKILSSILEDIKKFLTENNITIYDELTNNGIFRAIMLRKTSREELMLVFVLTKFTNLKELVDLLIKKYNINSIYININDKKTNVVLGDKDILVSGKDTIKETILNHDFMVSPKTFLQINHRQTEKLYTKAIEMLNPSKDDYVIDAYCGMGSITLSIAPFVKEVYGIEIVKEAIKDANNNKKINNINNANFICGKCEDIIMDLINKKPFSAIVFDPPRKGCEKSFLDVIKKSKIRKIVYISCNIATCARDILHLSDTYKLVEAVPVDLFPRSLHIETICTLIRKD